MLPDVERAPGHLEHATQHNDRVLGLLHRDEPIAAHRVVSLAKKAAAFRRISRSSSSTRFSRRKRASSSRSAVVNPSRCPASIAAWATQRCTVFSARPSSRQTCAIDLPELRISVTVSLLNSLLNFRLASLAIQADSIGASIPLRQLSAEPGQLQYNVRQRRASASRLESRPAATPC